ncbi:MAG: MHYT domain-containing protein, partial [Hyphomicrobiaceae bacterium]
MSVITCVYTEHNLWLVILAVVICIAGSAIALSLFTRVRERVGTQKIGWLFLAAVAAGSSIWCTHFIAMLAFKVSAPVTFDPILTITSLFVAIIATGIGFGMCALREDKALAELCGAVVGLGIAVMHYCGMLAYHVDGAISWDWPLVATSIAISVLFSAVCLKVACNPEQRHGQVAAVGLFVFAVTGMHFTGMTAVDITPLPTSTSVPDDLAFETMAVAIAGISVMIMGMGVTTFLIDERTSSDTFAMLSDMALSDSLTGLPNRVHFSRFLDLELKQATVKRGKLAIFLIDLNSFKALNDARGHQAGDETLRTIGTRLANLRQADEYVARIGDDEFAAIKHFAERSELNDFISRLRAALSEPVQLDGFAVHNGGTVGVALFPEHADQGAHLISNADLAARRAKS